MRKGTALLITVLLGAVATQCAMSPSRPGGSTQTGVQPVATILSPSPVPLSVAVISSANIDQLGQVARFGKGTVEHVDWSPDGKLLAVSSSLGVYLYDGETAAETKLLATIAPVLSSAFSPAGKLLAAAGKDKTVRLWDVASGEEWRALTGHTAAVTSLAFSPDGKVLASGSEDNTVRLWDVATGNDLLTLTGHTDLVVSVAFSPDGKLLASGGWDKTVKLWEVATGKEVRTLTGHTGYVESVAFSPDGKLLASGSRDTTLRLWGVR